MKHAIDNGLLLTDLDFNNWRILNPGSFHVLGLVETDDARLSDARFMLNGSVTNISVADNAGIEQSKLNLDLDCPPNFISPVPVPPPHGPNREVFLAARGDLVQPTSEKGQPNGYAALGANGRLLSGTVPLGTGTLTMIDFDISELTVVPSSITTTRTFTGYWNAQAGTSWFGRRTDLVSDPQIPIFNAPINPGDPVAQFPVNLIPDFDASRITSGVFSLSVLPVAQGVGANHSAGMVPDPGGDDPNQINDYLARDMTYKQMTQFVSYQPFVPAPSITFLYWDQQSRIRVTGPPGANLFYATQFYNPPQPRTAFVEITTTTLSSPPLIVPDYTFVYAYSAKVGYNNSPTASYYTGPGQPPQDF